MTPQPAPLQAGHLERVAAELWPVATGALVLAAGTFFTAWCWIPLLLCLVAAAVRGQELWDQASDPEDEAAAPRTVQWQAIPAALATLVIGIAAVTTAAEFAKTVFLPAIAALNLPGIATPVADALRAWFSTATTGLPITAGQLMTLWAGALAATIIGGLCGFRGAQLGYGLLTGATSVMVWQGAATAAHRPALVLAVLLAAAVLGIPVLRRAPRTRPHRTQP